MTNRPGRRHSELFREVFDTFHDFFQEDFLSSIKGVGDRFNIDVRDEGSCFVVEAMLPGFQSDGIHIEYGNEYVAIKAVHNQTDKVEGNKFFRQTSQYEEFHKKIYLGSIKGDEITASFSNDVLILRVPKNDNSLSRRRFLNINENQQN
ncbi:Hsp20 family protein [Alteribacillus bidgolensis]|uniref:Heat shock protein Hsp20 n=1 Tax=Alteribacillus bidgolensis TaxID=930129 RepID=A0A1G8MEC2_9BACI|nr:Hsp20 family protein [Alteribacillus bidgolensis]SDI66261.1 heat shock protein Hsp20 [Alteribacillus bidgolensis]